MALSLKPEHLRRYRDLVRLLVKYGRDVDLEGGAASGLAAMEDDGEVPPDAEAFAADLEAMGPTFVKLGQLLSTRADLLPPAYLRALGRLQDDVEPFPFGHVQQIVEEELQGRLDRLFESFDTDPLAAASLGQVHRATLPGGRVVAVKVQRPDIRERIVQDLDALAEVAGVLDRRTEVGRRFGLGDMLDQFRRAMLDELDYRREADNLRTLHHALERYDRLLVPLPVDDRTTTRVLTMEFVGGQKVTAMGPLTRTGIDGCELADQLFRAYLHQVLDDGFFHADPHPGNVFLTDDGRLALIDLGMVARVPESMRDNLLKLLLAASEGRGEEVARVALELGERRPSFDAERFTREVALLVAEHQGRRLEEVAAGAIVVDLTRIAGESGLRPASELVLLGKALLNLDEVARTLDPAFDPNRAIREEAGVILRNKVVGAASPANLLSVALEAKEFAEKLPSRVNKVMDALAEGELRLHVDGIDEKQFLRGMQKIANRVTMGLLLAAMIVGAAMLVRVPTPTRLFGYPALAMACFLAAGLGALILVISIIVSDRD